MERIRVAHIVSAMELYGKEKWILALLGNIDIDHFPSMVITITKDGSPPLADYVRDLGMDCYPLRITGKFSFGSVRELAGLVREHRIDILHSHDYKADMTALAARRLQKVRIISTPHGWSNAFDVKLQLYQLLNKLAFFFFDRVAPLSPQLEDSIRFIGKRRLALIRNFVDISSLPQPAEHDFNVISCVGRLTRLKRVEDAIASLRYVRDGNLRLQIIGEGPLRKDLEALVLKLGLQERVRFYGFRRDCLDLLNRSAVLVHPSSSEGTSRVIMEAMTLKRIVVGTDIPGVRTLINNGENGLLVPVNEPRAIAEALDWVVENKEGALELGDAAREFIEKRHSARAVAKEYEALYKEIQSSG